MSLDNIPLTSNLYRAFFKNSLFDLTKNLQQANVMQQAGIDFLGENEKKIVFISTDNENKYLNDIQMGFLKDLLLACHLTLSDIALVNFSHNGKLNIQRITDAIHPNKILIFGISASELDLPFNIPHFQIQNFNEQVFLMCPALEQIQANVDLKKNLWVSLQKIFTINKKS